VALAALAAAIPAAILVLRYREREDNQVRWSNMVWQPAALNGNTVAHAALMVEAALAGSPTPAVMQLDLGTPQTLLYNPGGAEKSLSVSGTIASRKFRNERFAALRIAGAQRPATTPILAGTVGADFFEHRILLLDFVMQRLAILGKDAPLPPGLDRNVEYLPLDYRHGHVFVAATIDGHEDSDLFFDTGSSMMALATGRTHWREWTHRRPDDPANVIVRVNSWGKQAVLVGAPIPGTLCIGSACLFHPLIYFESSGLENIDFDKLSSVASGVIGNLPFDGRFTVIVDIPGRRFGLLRGSL
jgi:hypothetical protein